MKKILSILALALFSVTAVHAQKTIPRWSTVSTGDNTGRVITYKKIVPATDAVLHDTIAIKPGASYTYVEPVSITDTVTYNVSTANAYEYDEVTFVLKNSSGSNHQVRWIGVTGQGTVALTTATYATVTYVFNGTVWVEKCRVVL